MKAEINAMLPYIIRLVTFNLSERLIKRSIKTIPIMKNIILHYKLDYLLISLLLFCSFVLSILLSQESLFWYSSYAVLTPIIPIAPPILPLTVPLTPAFTVCFNIFVLFPE
jgi:hypothetical protein